MALFKCEQLNNSNIYGVEWKGGSFSGWTRTDGAAGLAFPSPAVSNGSGSSPFDNIMPWKGLKRVTDNRAGVLVEIPKYYYKWSRDGIKMKLQISPEPFIGSYISPAHADRGDGKGERDVVYVGAYSCAASTYKSTSGVTPQTSKTRTDFRTSIHNLGSTIWQFDFAMWWTINMLYLVEYANWNSQAKIGYGCANVAQAVENTGLCDAMAYHTGTNAANRTTYGHTRYRYIEDFWGGVETWCDGIYFSTTDVYCIKNPADFNDTSGGTLVGTRPNESVSGLIKAWTDPSATGFEYALFPSVVESTAINYYDTYICDNYNSGSGSTAMTVGGGPGQSQYRGAFEILAISASNVSDKRGSRLQKLP